MIPKILISYGKLLNFHIEDEEGPIRIRRGLTTLLQCYAGLSNAPYIIGEDFYYYKNAVLHRDGDLPAVDKSDGTKLWFRNGIPHRDNGPAVISYYKGRAIFGYFKNGVQE